MSSTQHTPGPWACEPSIPGRRFPSVVFPGGRSICVNEPHTTMAQHDADARLIAAAPDLLEALREITADYADRFDLDSPSTNPGVKSSIKQARAAIAIAKATGSAS